MFRVARTGAVRARAKALTQLKALIVTAPDALRAQLDGLDGTRLRDHLRPVAVNARPQR